MKNKLTLIMFKTLSRNDTGETNSHQSGISITKEVAKTDIFPNLGIETLNPRTTLTFFDEDGDQYKFEYIYYNDKFHGKDPKKAHNEYRLTRVIDFLRKVNARAGDQIWFGLDSDGGRRIGLIKQEENTETAQIEKLYQPIQPISKSTSEDDEIYVDVPILDPYSEVTPQIVILNKGWVKVELK